MHIKLRGVFRKKKKKALILLLYVNGKGDQRHTQREGGEREREKERERESLSSLCNSSVLFLNYLLQSTFVVGKGESLKNWPDLM